MGEEAIAIRFDSAGLVPVVACDEAGGVLMLAYADAEAVAKTQETGEAHFFSRSRGKLWKKGETSGNRLLVREIRIDCDGDALLYVVAQTGPACHTGRRSCFYRRLDGAPAGAADASILGELEAVLKDRKEKLPEGSYTARLFSAPAAATHRKIGEEAFEVVLASESQGPERLASETADLFFHALVLLVRHGVPLANVFRELEGRRK